MTEQQIESLIAMDSEAIKFALLTLQAKLAEALNANAQGRPSPSTPSGSVAPYLKPESKTSTKAKRSARPNRCAFDDLLFRRIKPLIVRSTFVPNAAAN